MENPTVAHTYQFFRSDINSHHIGAKYVGDHNSRKTDPAATVYRNPLPGRNTTLGYHCTK